VRALAAALAVVLGTCLACSAADAGTAGRVVTVRDPSGALLAQVPLEGDAFAVSYRNSLYGTPAEERYHVGTDGGFTLVELAADQIAVLEEYYGVPGPVRRAPDADRRNWVALPARTAGFTDLAIAATDLGERTLHVPGRAPVPLAPLITSGPTVVVDVEEAS
jgi:hypothetical protein